MGENNRKNKKRRPREPPGRELQNHTKVLMSEACRVRTPAKCWVFRAHGLEQQISKLSIFNKCFEVAEISL